MLSSAFFYDPSGLQVSTLCPGRHVLFIYSLFNAAVQFTAVLAPKY